MRCSVQCDDTLTQDEQDEAHSSVRVDVLCVEDSHGCHWCRSCNRAMTPLTFVVLVQLRTCSQMYAVIVNSFL